MEHTEYLRLIPIEGKIEIACPAYKHEFKVSVESIKRGEMHTCPICKNRFQFTYTRECLSRLDLAQAERIISNWRTKQTLTGASNINMILKIDV
jgi:predicted  nucleic acid-binding Zn ribbon protein